jgi:hypothetical protein
MSASIHENCIEILRRTHDGDDLSPEHLRLVEIAVNAKPCEKIEAAIMALLARCRAGYEKPWFHGIEHLTIDHVGYVFWKGRDVEHYDNDFAFTERGKRSATELAERCRHLESIDVEVTCSNAIWKWERFAPNAV